MNLAVVHPLTASLVRTSSGGSVWGTVILVLFLFVVIAAIASAMASPKDGTWLPITIIVAFVAKLGGSTARYLVLELLYGGRGDATGYHGAGLALSEVWRSFQLPTGITRIGTDVVDAITGLLYVPYQPSKLGGFYIFAALAFCGQLLLYAAFRHSFPERHLKWYAALVFFWPTTIYWPSSIGKESLMLLWIGIASYGIARMLVGFKLGWAGIIAIGLAGAGIIRAHMALLLAGGLFAAVLLARPPKVPGVRTRQVLLGAGGAISIGILLLVTAQSFGVNLAAAASVEGATDEVGAVLEGVESQTQRGGSAIEEGGISSPADVPGAIVRVLFSPLPHEADSALLLAQSLEGTVLLIVVVVRLPWILRNMIRIRKLPYAAYCLAYSGGFIFAFSSILNLGILARQRSQLMPLFLVLVVVLGRKWVDVPEASDPVSPGLSSRLQHLAPAGTGPGVAVETLPDRH